MIKKLINYISIQKRKFKYQKQSYSFNGVDLIVNYIFKNKKEGFYLDIGAQHPISNNNTYILFKRGCKGINIDLDKKNIDLFKIARPDDFNLNYAISDSEKEVDLFFYHESSPINTLSKKVSNFQKANVSQVKKIKTTTEHIKGKFIKINNLLLVNLSIKKPEANKVITDKIEYTIKDWAITKVPHSLDSVINDW